MFFIVPENKNDLVEALGILAFYHVAAASYIENPDNLNSMYLAIIPDHYESEDDDVGLAEAAFMMNWHQGGECPECKDKEIEVCVDCDIRYSCDDQRGDCVLKNQKTTCGHMVFTKPIQPAF